MNWTRKKIGEFTGLDAQQNQHTVPIWVHRLNSRWTFGKYSIFFKWNGWSGIPEGKYEVLKNILALIPWAFKIKNNRGRILQNKGNTRFTMTYSTIDNLKDAIDHLIKHEDIKTTVEINDTSTNIINKLAIKEI